MLGGATTKRHLLILVAAILFIRAPFLDMPVQGDDVYYLVFANNALVDPLHPLQTSFRLQGETVWGAGHTRPPGNAWTLAALLAMFGGVREIPFHLAYLLFSVIAVWSVYFLARRLCDKPLWAALTFLAVPVFGVNGAKLESDLPLLAFWCLGFALFVHQRYAGAAMAMAAAGFFGYQAVAAAPILAHWAWFRDRRRAGAWLAVMAAPLALIAWQAAERLSVGAAPAEALAGYAQSYDLLALARKLPSAAALLGHLGWIVSPLLLIVGRSGLAAAVGAPAAVLAALLLPADYTMAERALYGLSAACGILVLGQASVAVFRQRSSERGFLGAWVLVFFAASLALFYAGSARYLLPLAPAVAILAVMTVRRVAWVAAGVALQLALGLALAYADFRYATQYPLFASDLAGLAEGRRIWSNAEWGLRHYLAGQGGEPLLAQQRIPPGSIVVESALAAHVDYSVEGTKRLLLEQPITSGSLPLRLIGPGSHSGYSSSEFGVLPFGIGRGEIDRISAYEVGMPDPRLAYLRMDDPAAEEHLLSGFFPSDGAEWRWMGRRGAALLRAPENASRFEAEFHIPDGAPARELRVEIDGRAIAVERYDAGGGYRLDAPLEVETGSAVRVALSVDAAYSPPGDKRELGIVMIGFGLR